MLDFISEYSSEFVAFLVGFIAIGLFYWERYKKKIDAAKIILQEIRRAEEIIDDYKANGKYHFTKKIIATNSWAKNIHFFVKNLDQDELDKISNLYSTGEYLDSIIVKISDYQFESQIKNFEEKVQKTLEKLLDKKISEKEGNVDNSENVEAKKEGQKEKEVVEVPLQFESPWKNLLDTITNKYEPIYHSDIGRKLKYIAKL